MSTYFIAFWNLENLFAPENYPEREPWIAKEVAGDLKGWSPDLFARKIGQLRHIITRMNGGAGPDLLGVCEVENRYCLDALSAALNAALPERRYDVVHFDSTKDHRGIDTAFLFDRDRLDVDPDKVFSHWVMRRTGTRDITQATFTTKAGNDFVALCNHWPSRSGGAANESAGFRMTAGETLGYWHERIREERGEDIPVIAMGDFNDDPHDPSLTIHARATRERDDVENATSARFYNLTWNILRQAVIDLSGKARTLYGSLYFKGDGNSFDQLLVSRAFLLGRSSLRVLEATTRIEAFPEMVAKSKNEGPVRFGLPKGDPAEYVDLDGFSDHFPVSVTIEETVTS
ncbi:endonuclease/exonuclease/phosphatase family protein [Pinisolibacter sp.]|uniref:endonuclease/exonuclease/phosphatase family protein n=1 Tax=Pinisolibacter sp. TaxID=2172024 RepID=UPI002FDC8144